MQRRSPPGFFAVSAFLVALLHPLGLSAQTDQELDHSAKPLIEIRFARQAPAPGFVELERQRSENILYVSEKNLFTDQDFEYVEAHKTPYGLVLKAHWKPESAERSASVQRGDAPSGNDHIAVFVMGKLVTAPRIVVDPQAVPVDALDIGVQVPASEADRIARAVAERWGSGETVD